MDDNKIIEKTKRRCQAPLKDNLSKGQNPIQQKDAFQRVCQREGESRSSVNVVLTAWIIADQA